MPLGTDILSSLAGPIMMGREGRSVTYKEPRADDKTITAVVGAVRADENPGDRGGRRREDTRLIKFLADPDAVPDGGVADPPLNASFIVTSEGTDVWNIRRVDRRDAGMVTVECVRMVPSEVSRPGFRRGDR